MIVSNPGINTSYMQKYISLLHNAIGPLLLFACKIHCLKTFDHKSAHWAIEA